MGYLEFARADIEAGRLVQPFELSVRHDFSYYVVHGDGQPLKENASAFAAWIRQEAAAFFDGDAAEKLPR